MRRFAQYYQAFKEAINTSQAQHHLLNTLAVLKLYQANTEVNTGVLLYRIRYDLI